LRINLKKVQENSLAVGDSYDVQRERANLLNEAIAELNELGFTAQNEVLQELNQALEDNGLAWEEWFGQQVNILMEFKQLSQEVFESFASGFGAAVARTIVLGESFGKAMKSLLRSVALAVISSVIKMAVVWVIQAVAAAVASKASASSVVSAKAAESAAGQFAAFSSLPFPANLAAPALTAGMMAAFAGLVGSATGLGAIATAGLKEGGLVTGPTLALLGEAGNELVTPLSKVKDMFGTREQLIQVMIGDDVIAEAAVRGMPEVLRVQAGIEI